MKESSVPMHLVHKGNIYSEIPGNLSKEVFETLLQTDTCKLERIISEGHKTPNGEWLSEEKDEWVVLLCGSAFVRFDDEDEPYVLGPGDYLYIPAFRNHRVEATDQKLKSIWLALHIATGGMKVSRERIFAETLDSVEVIRAPKRRKTSSARLVKGRLLVRVPQHISSEALMKVVEHFKRLFEKRRLLSSLKAREDLMQVAQRLNRKYFGNQLKVNSIEYTMAKPNRFGYCNYRNRSISIAHHVGQLPAWVRDCVIMHELAHLIRPDHSKAFWEILARYPLAERARGFLLAKGYSEED